MSVLKNNRLMRAIYREPIDATPVWVMRQAGRYLPEYRQIRAAAGSFMQLCKTPELACEVTLQPLARYALDAAIIFSDILTIPDAMGLGLSFIEGEGPRFQHPLRSLTDIKRLSVPDTEQLSYVYESIALVKKQLAGSVPLIGFCGSPWTLAAYMVEGRSKNGFPLVLNLLKEYPACLQLLLDTLARAVCAHLNAQIEAGVDVVMIFDTWGGLLNTEQYQLFSLYYIKHIIAGLRRNTKNKKIPVILFTKGGHAWLSQMAETGCEVLGLDWEISLEEARQRVGSQVILQGNMHPACLLQSPEKIRQEVAATLASFGFGGGHIFNLGHGITPDVPPEHLSILVDAVHELSVVYHKGES
jgi:uroporphyrinogen decarboxylase